MNKTVLITGANAGVGKETARQLAAQKEIERIYLACRNPQKAEAAKRELEQQTGRKIFEIVLMDMTDQDSVKKLVSHLQEPIDALVMNAGGMGGNNPDKLKSSGMNAISAQNLLGHKVLMDELLSQNKLNNVAMFASSEAARGIKKMSIPEPSLKSNSTEEMISVLNGQFFDKKFDAFASYGMVKYIGTLWMSSLARKHPNIRFVSVSPGATQGTSITNSISGFAKFMFKYIMMPIVMPLRGMAHKVDKGAKRYVDAVNSTRYETGRFYASAESKVIGDLVDQAPIYKPLTNETYQDNAAAALSHFA